MGEMDITPVLNTKSETTTLEREYALHQLPRKSSEIQTTMPV